MKILPPSWTKSKNKQLSFADTLFDKPTKEDLFVDRLISELKNVKFLRYRANYARIKKVEQLGIYTELSDILDLGANILADLAKKTKKHKSKTIEDFITDIVIEKITWPPTDTLTYSELKYSHEHAKARIVGMFLANKDILKRNKREVRIIIECFDRSHIILHRLNVI